MKSLYITILLTLLFSVSSSAQEFDKKNMEQILREANQGNPEAQNTLGDRYWNARGVPRNDTEAVRWYRKAAEQGNAEAQNQLAELLRRGFGAPMDLAEAAMWYRKSAEQGNKKAQNALGELYSRSDGTPQDVAEAVKWYRKAAEQGFTEAQNKLADMYYHGTGTTRDYTEAMKWYRKAAGQNSTPAHVMIGDMYYNGEGMPRDFAEALKWYRKVAEHRVDVQVKLGDMYLKGEGVSPDNSEAEKWYRKAASRDGGYKEANLRLDQMGLKVRAKTFLLTSSIFLFFPFVFFAFWGPFAFVYAKKVIVKRLSSQLDMKPTIQRAFIILTVIFLPVIVISKGGNIPVIFPWWLATLAMFMPGPGEVDPSRFPSMFIFSVPFVPIIWFYITREVRRQHQGSQDGA